ncbi:hypothetical protein M758_2G008600 [Ceratodon purpureus]|nr:hypothetical protein M758_2G008600 [Ceratodon purpureus]
MSGHFTPAIVLVLVGLCSCCQARLIFYIVNISLYISNCVYRLHCERWRLHCSI